MNTVTEIVLQSEFQSAGAERREIRRASLSITQWNIPT